MMSLAGLHVADGARQVYRLEDLAVVGKASLLGRCAAATRMGSHPGRLRRRIDSRLLSNSGGRRYGWKRVKKMKKVIADTPGVLISDDSALSSSRSRSGRITHSARISTSTSFARQGPDKSGDLGSSRFQKRKRVTG